MGTALVIKEAQGDLAVGPNGLEQDTGLGSLLAASLLSDARARAEDLAFAGMPANSKDLRGYWADTPEDRFGSRLWLLDRAKQTRETLARAQDYAQEALAWMVAEGILERVEVTATFPQRGALHLAVRLIRGRARRWASLWENPVAGVFSTNGLVVEVS